MLVVTIILVVASELNSKVHANQILDENLSFIQIITKYGYPVEQHQITTEDGYILNTYRIPHGRVSKKRGNKVALLVHGLSGSAENFAFLGPDDSLAFILADRGFDVWLFNARGVQHSRKHRVLTSNFPMASKFWNFSWHEIAIYDLPANIDYILQKTGQSELFYVGHSQGTTIYLVLTSEKPEYNSKIKVAALLAPAILMKYLENHLIKVVSMFSPLFQGFLDMFNVHELPFPNFPMIRNFLKRLCLSRDFMEACVELIYFIGGQDSGLFNVTLLPFILTHAPSSFSTRQVSHYAQEIKSGYFRKYDYGVRGNLKAYNQKYPPEYNVNNSVAPVALFFGNGDTLTPVAERDNLAQIIPNVVLTYEVPHDRFNHLDFLVATNVRELLYEPVYNLFMDFTG